MVGLVNLKHYTGVIFACTATLSDEFKNGLNDLLNPPNFPAEFKLYPDAFRVGAKCSEDLSFQHEERIFDEDEEVPAKEGMVKDVLARCQDQPLFLMFEKEDLTF